MAKIQIPDREFIESPVAQPIGPVAVVGSQVAKLGEQFQKAEEISFISNEVTSRYTNAIKESSDWIDQNAQDKNNFGTLKERFKKFQIDLRKRTFEGLNNEEAKRRLNERFTTYAARQSIAVSSQARIQGIAVAKEQTSANLKNLTDQAINAKNADVPDIMTSARELITAQVVAGNIIKSVGEEALKKLNGEVQEGRIVNMLRTNPSGALKVLNQKGPIPGITPVRRLQLQRTAKSIIRTNQAVASHELAQVKVDNLNSIKLRGKGDPTLLAKVYATEGKKAGDAYKKAQETQVTVNAGVEFINSSTVQEANKFVQAEVAKVKSSKVKGFTTKQQILQQYVKAANLRLTQFRTDKAAYYESNPAIKELDKQAAKVSAVGSEIGTFLNESENPLIKSVGAMFNTAANTTLETMKSQKLIALQRSDKVDEQKIVLLKNNVAKGMVAKYNSFRAEEKPQYLAALRAKHKEDYPIVFRDLMRNGLPPEANVINSFATNPNGIQLTLDLTEAAKVGDTKLREGIDNRDMKVLNTAIDNSLQTYISSTQASKRSALDINFVLNLKSSVRKIALVRRRLRGMSLEQAGSSAADDVINSQYDYYSAGTRKFLGAYNIRVPKAVNMNSVINFARLKLPQLNKFDVEPGLNFRAPGSPRKTRQKDYINRVMNGGTWVTNKSDDGLILIDSGGRPVINGDGQRFGFRFDEI